MNQPPTVSVILPNFNHEDYLQERIESILSQTYRDFELILLDDCSTDDSRSVLQRYANHPQVSALVLNETNTGNTFLQWDKGIGLARGRYVWIAESDDVADPHFLEATVSALQAHPHATMCLTGSILIDEHSRPQKHHSRDLWRETGEVKCFDGTSYVRHNLLYRNNVYNASMVVFRRDVYDNLDKSFQHLRCTGDWQFWVEVALMGQVLEVRSKLNRFRQHTNKVTYRAWKTGEGVADMIEVMRYVLDHVPVSPYRKLLVRGECYRSVRRCKTSKDIRARLYLKAGRLMQTNAWLYWLTQLNKTLAPVVPGLATHRKDKLK